VSPPSPQSPQCTSDISPLFAKTVFGPTEQARRKKLQDLNEQLKVCTDAGDWESATLVMEQLRSRELRQTSLKIKKERLDPTASIGDRADRIERMFKVEKQLIRSLAKVRSDMQLLKRGSSAR